MVYMFIIARAGSIRKTTRKTTRTTKARITFRSHYTHRQHSDQQDQCQAQGCQVLENILHITFLLQLCFQMSIMGYGRSP